MNSSCSCSSRSYSWIDGLSRRTPCTRHMPRGGSYGTVLIEKPRVRPTGNSLFLYIIFDVMNDATDGFPLDSAPRPSTSRVIAEALRAAIVEGTLAPGAPLRQDAIARHFSVSAIPVREALRALESEGWVKVELNK